MLEEDETALGKVLLGATSVCTIYIYIIPMCYVRSFDVGWIYEGT